MHVLAGLRGIFSYRWGAVRGRKELRALFVAPCELVCPPEPLFLVPVPRYLLVQIRYGPTYGSLR